ncbi:MULTISPECIES: ABC transporter permease [unclassified Variovorax]|jgi:ribose transport system permease protein|uniref:ABC transporter permease n=1 Tax=unclassified Variovorax TaxID=663243 RepID=UPI002B23B210|nr:MULTISPECIES: ABC transporter permease [unclassified Variovorax]MEB0057028.1 ABC transporter permease [Variovorax sp. LG9.2]MEB0112275.1 ABC transporter permease [Variovorax sp. RTB1]
MHSDAYYRLREHRATLIAVALFVVIFALYIAKHQVGWTVPVLTTAANKGVLLAIVAMAQTLVVLTGGIDLSVGMVFVLANCLASHLVVGTPLQAAVGVIAVLAAGAACGFVNGAIIVYGRLQPIITTLATGIIYFGFSLGLRPVPGGDVQADLAEALTGALPGGVPTMLVVLLAVVLLVWVPYSRSVVGRAALAIGSSEAATYMSGVAIGRARIVAYTLAGFLAAVGGLLLTFVTFSGEASAAIGGVYTLNAIAAVVIGGTVLSGGAGSAIGSIFGAFTLRTIGDLLFVFDLEPLWQPLFQGVILLVAVSLGSLRLLRLDNRLDMFR